ncbi:unnamed protein product [Angiostrongylus costaricensis]|uniref:DUF1863 domain-containing protein n=1 Tax=Angiostrongylus costaricensis TaxID=334426 RepID=A0A0R3PYP1_ANGCS|nr:unnamed protein product [Angiostrongylus costaricensis]
MQTFFVFSSDDFDILNEWAYYEQVYKDLGIGIDERLFAINGPFLMDSQFEAMKKEVRRVRKRKKPDCSAVKCSNEFAAIERIAKAVRETGHRVGFFSNQSNRDNNRVARDAVRELLESRIEMHKPQAIVTNEITIIDDNRKFVVEDEFCMLNSWYRNDSDCCIRLNVSMSNRLGLPSESANETPSLYYVPPKATFHVGCVSDVRNFTAINGVVYFGYSQYGNVLVIIF